MTSSTRSGALAALAFLALTVFSVYLSKTMFARADAAPGNETELNVVAGQTRDAGTDGDYTAGIDEWHQGREDRLRRETGWLSLVGLHPLDEGDNTFGSSENNTMQFPSGPERAGVITRKGDTFTLVMLSGEATIDDASVTNAVLLSDAADDGPTQVDVGRFNFYVIQRGDKVLLRVKDRESEVRKRFTGIDRYPVQSDWRIVADYERYIPPKKVIVPDVLGHNNEEECHGAIVFEWQGSTHRLEPLGMWDDELFLVFADETSGRDTYGGGRFVYTGIPENGKVVVDFNKAYNPPCVFTPYATCPLPSPDNVLPFPVTAGEKNWGHH